MKVITKGDEISYETAGKYIIMPHFCRPVASHIMHTQVDNFMCYTVGNHLEPGSAWIANGYIHLHVCMLHKTTTVYYTTTM